MEFLTLNKLKKLLKEEDLDIKKRLGQHFLIDRNAKDKIISFAELEKDDIVIEIGAGLGALTGAILDKAACVYAFEVDSQFCSILRKRFSAFENFHLIEKDFLKSSEEWWASLPKKVKVIGNTPYYMSSPIVFHILNFREKIELALLTVQKEVGERFIAGSGSKRYGIISVLLALYTDARMCYSPKKAVFYPNPGVESTVVKITPFSKPEFCLNNERKFRDFLPLIFSHRRKKLSNVINSVFHIGKEDIENRLEKAGISKNIRIEQLPPEEICKVYQIIYEK